MKTDTQNAICLLAGGLIATIGMLFASQCSAATGRAATLSVDTIGEVRGDAGQSLVAFLNRAGLQLRQYSQETGFEACGAIAKAADGTYALTITTNRSHMGCVIHRDLVPAGYTATADTIHSHGRVGTAHANRADTVFSADASIGAPIYVSADDLHTFSAVDYAAGPMYLATDNGVAYQNGAGTSHIVTE